MLITSVGGIILAFILTFYFSEANKTAQDKIEKLAGNHINHNTEAITALTEVVRGIKDEQKETQKLIQANTAVIQSNTDLLKTIFNRK